MSRSAKRELACNHVDLVQILVVVAMILLRATPRRAESTRRARLRLIHRRLKRSRFPCEQYLDMGQSVLTPEESLLGKVSLRVESLDIDSRDLKG